MIRERRAFTLVEILIVVIILGILAGIVIPQFGSFTEDANTSRLTSDLRMIRGQISQFYFDHGYYPGDNSAGKDGSSYDAAQFITDLTGATNGIGGEQCGPYMDSFPVNPFANTNGGQVSLADAMPAGGIGWWFDKVNYRFQATISN